MEMPVVSNSRINSILYPAVPQFPFSSLLRREIQFNNKNYFHAPRNDENTVAKIECLITRTLEIRSADRECMVCLYKQNTGISSNPIRQRRANYRESPFSDSRLFLGTIPPAFHPAVNSRTIQPTILLLCL